MSHNPESAPGVSLELLDANTGQPQQSWRFAGLSRIQIGRSRENDLVIANPYVSRSHAYIDYSDGRWTAVAISTQLLMTGGRRVQAIELTTGTIFALGPHGSSLRFTVEVPEAETTSVDFDFRGTLSADLIAQPALKLDTDLLAKEVTAIKDSEFFQGLAQNLKNLRRAREENR